MPTEDECKEYFNTTVKTFMFFSMEESHKLLTQKWPDKQDRNVYYDWIEKMMNASLQTEWTAVTKPELQKWIDEANYNVLGDRQRLVQAMSRQVRPWIGVGKDYCGNYYRLVPAAYGLIANNKTPETTVDLLSSNVLGISIIQFTTLTFG
jgi:hypothetical protein